MAAPSQFRLGPHTLADLDALAASAGTRSDALRECIAYWHRAVAEAARLNAEELTPEEWVRLGYTGDPGSFLGDEDQSAVDWSRRLAIELVGMYEGKAYLLPEHMGGQKEAKKLAKKIGGWGIVRGYAMMAAVRYLWIHQDTGPAWWQPEVWMTADVRPEAAK